VHEVPPTESHAAVRLTLVRGRGLDDHDVGKQDPFVELTLAGRTLRSKTASKGGTEPDFGGEQLAFTLEGEDCARAGSLELQIVCKDEDTLSNDLIGTATVSVASLASGAVWVELRNGDKAAGEVQLAAELVRSVPAQAPGKAAPATAAASDPAVAANVPAA
jgi:Ca2+-dependent lipid-binding protein